MLAQQLKESFQCSEIKLNIESAFQYAYYKWPEGNQKHYP
jgi:hypothetical protein